jgi:hypothetical protein
VFLENGADSNLRDSTNKTPLYPACQHGDVDTVWLLLHNISDIHAQVEGNQIPLHLASAFGRDDVMQSSLEYRAKDHGVQCPWIRRIVCVAAAMSRLFATVKYRPKLAMDKRKEENKNNGEDRERKDNGRRVEKIKKEIGKRTEGTARGLAWTTDRRWWLGLRESGAIEEERVTNGGSCYGGRNKKGTRKKKARRQLAQSHRVRGLSASEVGLLGIVNERVEFVSLLDERGGVL